MLTNALRVLVDVLFGRAGLVVIVEDDISPEEAAARREEWRVSSEAGRWAARSRLLALLLVPLGATGGALLWSQTSSALTDGGWFNKFGPGVLLGAAVATVVTGTIAASYRQTLLRIVTDRRILHAAKLELDEAEQHVAQSGDSDTDLDLGAVWAATQRRLDYYHKIALSQSRNSFLFGQGAAIGGFIVLVLGAIVAAASRETTGAVVAGALGAVGAALSAFISATFAKSQESATKQLRDYFAQPLHLSKVLTAERLASQLPEDQRAPVIEVIVRAIFNERIEE